MRLVAVLTCAALIMPASVFGQAGSTGGTIGKTDKSISGGEEQTEPQHRPEGKRSPRGRPVKSEKTTGNPCQKIIGRWTWNDAGGTTKAVFGSGGTGQNVARGLTSTWTCSGAGIAIVRWSNGISDRVTISPDGNSLSIANPYGGVFSAVRN
jgi:hypothetical protein